MANKIKTFKDSNGDIILPRTVATAVKMVSGDTLDVEMASKASQTTTYTKDEIDAKVQTDVPAGAVFTDTVVDISGKVDNSRVLTDVPADAVFTDTVFSGQATDVTLTDTGLYFTSDNVEGALQEVGLILSSPAAPTNFAGLTDTPESYVGHAGKVAKVKDTEDGLEFSEPITLFSVSDTLDIENFEDTNYHPSITNIVFNKQEKAVSGVDPYDPIPWYQTSGGADGTFYSMRTPELKDEFSFVMELIIDNPVEQPITFYHKIGGTYLTESGFHSSWVGINGVYFLLPLTSVWAQHTITLPAGVVTLGFQGRGRGIGRHILYIDQLEVPPAPTYNMDAVAQNPDSLLATDNTGNFIGFMPKSELFDGTASNVTLTDTGTYYDSDNVEGALQEVGLAISNIPEGTSYVHQSLGVNTYVEQIASTNIEQKHSFVIEGDIMYMLGAGNTVEKRSLVTDTVLATSPSTGNSILDLTTDDTHVYVVGSFQKIIRYLKTDLTFVDETASIGNTTSLIQVDDTAVYVALAISNVVHKYSKVDLSYLATSSAYTGSIGILLQDATHLYIQRTTASIWKLAKTDLSQSVTSTAYAIWASKRSGVIDNGLLYIAGVNSRKIFIFDTATLTLQKSYYDDAYGPYISTMLIDGDYLYYGMWSETLPQMIYKIDKETGGLIEQGAVPHSNYTDFMNMAISGDYVYAGDDAEDLYKFTSEVNIATEARKVSTLEARMGDRQYTEQNVVTNGETLTASINKLDIDAGAVTPYAQIKYDGTQSLSNYVFTTVSYNTELHDSDTMFDGSVDNTEITINTEGMYLIVADALFSEMVAGDVVEIRLFKNGVEITGSYKKVYSSANVMPVLTVVIQHLSISDYIQIQVRRTSGNAITLIGATATITKVG